MKLKPTKKMVKKYCLLPKSYVAYSRYAGNNEYDVWFDTKKRRQHRVITAKEFEKMQFKLQDKIWK